MSLVFRKPLHLRVTSLTAALGLATGVAGACTVNAVTLQFGDINPLVASVTTGTAAITVHCPTSTSYSIALSVGNGASFTQRSMQSGTNLLYYQLYSDASNAFIWGDGTGASTVVNAAATSSGTSSSVYGRIPHQQGAVPGVYVDTIIVTVSY